MAEREAALARKTAQPQAPPSTRSVLQTTGVPLPVAVGAQLGPRLGHDFAHIPIRPPSTPVGDVSVRPGGDLHEAAADAIADRAVAGPASRAPAADFSAVRIHVGPAAAASAHDVGARAYTVGHQIVFGDGEYQPGSGEGRRLLAHELAHVGQQSCGAVPIAMQRQTTVKPKPAPQAVTFWFSVRVDRELTSDELLLEFVRQYNRLASAAEAAKLRGWHWIDKAQIAGPVDVRKGYLLIKVRDITLKSQDAARRRDNTAQVKKMAPEAQAELNAEVDKEFWERTNFRVGGQLGNEPDDKKMAEYWLTLRDELIRKQTEISALPPAVRRFLFDENAPRAIQPADYDTVLRIATKLSRLSDAELEDYKNRITATTTSWADLEASIGRYTRERARREAQAKDTEVKKTRIYGLEELYDKYKEWKALKGSATAIPARDEFGVADPNRAYFEAAERSSEAEFMAALEASKFASVEAFEEAIHAYQDAFRRETVDIGLDMLDHYEHLLFEEKKKYTDPAAASTLAQAIGSTGAKADFTRAREAESAARGITPDPELHRFLWGEFELKQSLESQGRSARGAAEAAVNKAAADPVVSEPDFDREKLARAVPGEVGPLMLDYIAARSKDVRDTRTRLQSDPDLVFSLPNLLAASFRTQGIEPKSIYGRLATDKIADVQRSGLFVKIAIAVFAVALGLLTLGTGTVAVLAAVGAFGISAYQAVESFHEYEVAHAAHGAKLLSDDPSFGWVIVAIVGAGVDLGVAVSIVKGATPAIEAFNATGDLVKLEKDLAAIEGVTEAMRQNVLEAAAAEKEFKAAARGLLEAGSTLKSVLIPVEGIGELVKLVYYGVKKGVLSLERLVLTLRQEKLLAEAALTPEELARLRELFEEATKFVDEVKAHGTSLGMTEREIDGFIELWAKSKDVTLGSIKSEMTVWAATKKSGIPFGFANVEQLDAFKASAVKGLKKAGYNDAEAILQGSAVSGVSYTRKLPFGAESDFDVGIASRTLFEKARKAGLKVESNPMRIGPLDDDAIDLLGLRKLRRDFEAGTESGREVNFMLYSNRTAAETGIAGIAPESMLLK